METDQIIRLIQEVSNSNLSSFKYDEDNFTIELYKDKNINQEAYKSLVEENKTYLKNDNESSKLEESGKKSESSDKYIIKSPIVGTFYTSSSEDGAPFIEVGDEVKKGQVIAIVEAMKIMNEIESTVDGLVEEILVENQEIVEYGQPLVLIKP